MIRIYSTLNFIVINNDTYPKDSIEYSVEGDNVTVSSSLGTEILASGDYTEFANEPGVPFASVGDFTNYLDSILFQQDAGGTPGAGDSVVETAFTSVLDFSGSKKMATASQSGPIAFTLAAVAHKVGSTIAVKIIGDGVNGVTFSPDFKVFGSFDSTKVNYLTFYCHEVNEIWVTVMHQTAIELIDATPENRLPSSIIKVPPYQYPVNTSITNGIEDPMGGNEATAVNTVEEDAKPQVEYHSVPLILDQTDTISIYVKKGELSSFIFSLYKSDFTSIKGATIDLNTGNIINQTGTGSVQVSDIGSGWYRLSLTYTSTVTEGGRLYMEASTTSGLGPNKFYMFGLQLNEGTDPAAYIRKA